MACVYAPNQLETAFAHRCAVQYKIQYLITPSSATNFVPVCLMSPYQSYLDNERIGMAPNAYRPNVIIPENLFTPDSWDLDFPMFEYTSSSRDIFEPTQPPSIGESFPVPSWQTLSDTPSAQTTERNPFSSLPAPPVVPSFHSQITIVPVGNLVRVWNPYYDRAVGPNLWPTSGTYPPITVPTILPVRFVGRIPKNTLISRTAACLIFVLGCSPPS